MKQHPGLRLTASSKRSKKVSLMWGTHERALYPTMAEVRNKHGPGRLHFASDDSTRVEGPL